MKNIFSENGWVFATYEFNGMEYNLANSNMFANDVLGKLMLLIYSFILEGKGHDYIIWNQESAYHIFEYVLENGIIYIKLYYCDTICYEETISKNLFDNRNMELLTDEKKIFWDWAEKTFNNIDSFYQNKLYIEKLESKKAKELIRKIKPYFK